MKKDILFQRIEELNVSPQFNKSTMNEYKQILRELREEGVPLMSQTLINDEDREKTLASFSDRLISLSMKYQFVRYEIATLGELLDLNRVKAMSIPGLGTKKWLEIFSLQKSLYDLFPHKDIRNCESVNPIEETKEFIPYTREELQEINKEMLDCESSEIVRWGYHTKKYDKYLDELDARGQNRSDMFKDEDIYEVPAEILLEETGRIPSLINSSGIQKLVQILDFTEDDIREIRNQGIITWKRIVELKKDVLNNPQKYVKEYEEKHAIHVLPEKAEGKPLYERCIMALQQLAKYAEARGEERYSHLIREYFINGKGRKEIARTIPQVLKDKEKIDQERVRQIIEDYRMRIMSGIENPLVDNVYFSDELINELNELPQELLYHSLPYVNQCLQAPKDYDFTPIIRLLDLDILEVTKQREPFMDVPRVISSDESKIDISLHIKAIHYEMNTLARPAEKDEIVSLVMDSEHLPENFDINVIERVLTDHAWIEIEDGKYSYVYEKLWDAKAQAARIIYENRGREITAAEIKSIALQKNGKDCKFQGQSTMKTYPWVGRTLKNQYFYNPEQVSSLEPLHIAIEKYVKKNIRFYFSDMLEELKRRGYNQYSERSFRTYALKYCVPSNKDKNLFCLESEIKNYNDGTWRSRTTQGTTNWIINSCISILGSEKLKIRELRSRVFKQPEAENYNAKDITQYVAKYCCQYHDFLKERESNESFVSNMLFFIDQDLIWVNRQCIDEGLVDLEKIGFVNKQPDYYMTVMTEIVNQLKQAPDYRMKLADIRKSCVSLIQNPSKDPIFYKIVSKLPIEVEKIEIDGKIYLQYKIEKQTYEKTYSIVENPIDKQNDEVQIGEPQVVETTRTEKNYIRGRIDWYDMGCTLKYELNYYNRWWDIQNVTLDEGIEHFVSFLKAEDNDKVFHTDISRHIYEFLTQKLDTYDLHDHLRAITLGFETIVRKMYTITNMCDMPWTDGLKKSIALLPELLAWTETPIPLYRNQNFRTLYEKLKQTRNKFAHGADIEMNNVNKYQTTYSFLALYIYIYNRFVKQVALE